MIQDLPAMLTVELRAKWASVKPKVRRKTDEGASE